ncbi:MAG: formylglycine-generating enzyme family protein [Treponema sp.]
MNFTKKTFVTVSLILFLQAFLFSAEVKKDDRQKNSFSDINLVQLGPQEGVLFDTFVIGENSESITATRWITSFKMNKYETTYNLWYIVRNYAEERGYVFQNPGQEGAYGRRGKAPTKEGAYQPVTMVSWYDIVVWCNALSEMMGRTPCYYYNQEILRDATDTASCDMAECKWQNDGYRLPTEAEWEYAARVTKAGFQSGALASGQINSLGLDNPDEKETSIAWCDANTDTTHIVGTAGTIFNGKSGIAAAGSGNSNGAGLFDMSGNVLEYCWDWLDVYSDVVPGERATGPLYGSERVCRGGSWSSYTGFIYAGDRYGYDPNEFYNYLGFRFCTTK